MRKTLDINGKRVVIEETTSPNRVRASFNDIVQDMMHGRPLNAYKVEDEKVWKILSDNRLLCTIRKNPNGTYTGNHTTGNSVEDVVRKVLKI